MNKYHWVILLIIGFGIGYLVGTSVTIKAVTEIASGFVDKELIEQAIFQYKNNIGQCFPSVLP